MNSNIYYLKDLRRKTYGDERYSLKKVDNSDALISAISLFGEQDEEDKQVRNMYKQLNMIKSERIPLKE